MAFAKAPKPAKFRGANASMTIVTQDFGNLSADGTPYQAVGSNDTLIPCTIEVMSPGEAVKYGHAVNETVYRVLCPVMGPNGSSDLLKHNQYIIVSDHPTIADDTTLQINGGGKPEGDSGWQTAIAKKDAK